MTHGQTLVLGLFPAGYFPPQPPQETMVRPFTRTIICNMEFPLYYTKLATRPNNHIKRDNISVHSQVTIQFSFERDWSAALSFGQHLSKVFFDFAKSVIHRDRPPELDGHRSYHSCGVSSIGTSHRS